MTNQNQLNLNIQKTLQETKKSFEVLADNGKVYWVKKKNVSPEGTFIKYAPIQLDAFWRDVDSRIGMDVCTPFVNRFPGHSFVAFDNGLIWSKTLKKGFLTRNARVGRNSYPKSMKGRPYAFGADLSELEK